MASIPDNGKDNASTEDIAAANLVVRSEEEAFELLQRALASELEDQPYTLEFDNWPVLTLRYVGDGYESTITPHIAQALIELQHAMNRSYARLVRNAANANVLTKVERQSLEFKAKVDEGSSLIKVDLGEYAKTLTTALVGKMNGNQLVTVVLGVAFAGAGLLAYKGFLAARTEDRKIDMAVKQVVQLSEQETKRMEIFAQAMAASPSLKEVREDFDNVRHDILKSVGDATQLEVQGVALSQEQAYAIARTSRTRAEDVQLNGNYRIIKLDWSKEDEVRISLFGVDSEKRELVATMRAHNLTPANKKKLQDCEWGRKPVYLSINAMMLRGEVTAASIVGVEWPQDEAKNPSQAQGSNPNL